MSIDEILDAIGARNGCTRQTVDAPETLIGLSRTEMAAEFQRWSNLTGLSRVDLLNEIAKKVAIEFWEGRATFAFCDAIVNDLFEITFEPPRPELMWRVYLAFDDGESHGVEEQTIPQIAEIVRELRS